MSLTASSNRAGSTPSEVRAVASCRREGGFAQLAVLDFEPRLDSSDLLDRVARGVSRVQVCAGAR